MTINAFSPYNPSSPQSTQIRKHDNIVRFCEKICYDFHHNKLSATQCCEKLLDAAWTEKWDVPDKLIRNLNVYLSKVLERTGSCDFQIIINKIYDALLNADTHEATLYKGILNQEFIAHICQSEYFKLINPETISKMEDIICLSRGFHEYRFFQGWSRHKLFNHFISKFYRHIYNTMHDVFNYEKRQPKKTFHSLSYNNSYITSDEFSKRLFVSEFYGKCISNIINQVALTQPTDFKEQFNHVFQQNDLMAIRKLCSSILEKISENVGSDPVKSISLNVLPLLSSENSGGELDHFKQNIQSILCGKDATVQNVEDFTNFLELFLKSSIQTSFLVGVLNVETVKNVVECKLFSEEELTCLLNFLIKHVVPPRSLQRVIKQSPLKDAFFTFSTLPGIPYSVSAMIRWSLAMNHSPSKLCQQIEELSYTDWATSIEAYMDETELNRSCSLGKGFEFLQMDTEQIFKSGLLKKDIQYEVLNRLIEYSIYKFEFNTVDGGGSACYKTNLRRTLEKVAIDYPIQFRQILRPKIKELIDYCRSPRQGSKEIGYRCSCLLLQFSLGHLNDYVDEDIASLFIAEFNTIEDPILRRQVIKKILSHLTQEKVRAVGSELQDDSFFEKVKHELTSRTHPNFAHHIWLYVKSADHELFQEISIAMQRNIEWWNIVFNEKQEVILVSELVDALSSKLSDKTAAKIYPFLSLLIDSYKTAEDVDRVGKLILQNLRSKAVSSGNTEEYMNTFFGNLMRCLAKQNWNHYHTKLRIYQNPKYLVDELTDRTVNKSFLQVVIENVFQNPQQFANGKQIIIESVSSDSQWFDLFFNAISSETRLMTLLSSLHSSNYQSYTKILTREIMTVCGSQSSLERISRSVKFTCEFLAGKSIADKKSMILSFFNLLTSNNISLFFSFNKEEIPVFINIIKRQNMTFGTNFVASLFKQLNQESWFVELYQGYLHSIISREFEPDWASTLLPKK